jgi:hypothetical protein
VFDDLCAFHFGGCRVATIEVRFQNPEAEARVGSSGLPTVLNSIVNTVEVCITVGSCVVDFFHTRAPQRELIVKRRVLVLFDLGSGEHAARTAQQEANHARPPRPRWHQQANMSNFTKILQICQILPKFCSKIIPETNSSTL